MSPGWRPGQARSARGQVHYPGYFWSATTGAHVIYESRLELARLLLADFDRHVAVIAAQPFLLRARYRRPGPPRHDPGRRSLGLRPAGHLGARVTTAMLDWADLVLAMDSTVLAELRALAGDRASPELRLYAEGRDVPDPWGKDADAFNACAQLIEGAARRQAL